MGLIPCRLLPCAISRRTTNFPRGPGQGRWWCLQEASWVRTSAVARTVVLELQLQPSNSSFEKIPAPPGKRSLHAHALGRAPTGFRYLQFGPQLRRQCFLLPSSPCQGLPTLKGTRARLSLGTEGLGSSWVLEVASSTDLTKILPAYLKTLKRMGGGKGA